MLSRSLQLTWNDKSLWLQDTYCPSLFVILLELNWILPSQHHHESTIHLYDIIIGIDLQSLVDNRLMSITMIFYILLYLPSFWHSCLWLLALGRRGRRRLASKDDDGSTTTSSVGRSVGQYYYSSIMGSYSPTHALQHQQQNKTQTINCSACNKKIDNQQYIIKFITGGWSEEGRLHADVGVRVFWACIRSHTPL